MFGLRMAAGAALVLIGSATALAADGTLQVSGGLADKGALLQFLALFRQDQ